MERSTEKNQSIPSVLGELATGAKDVLRSELHLAREEFKETASEMGRFGAQAALFGGLLAISVFPFLAFLVIGIGKLLGDAYWLSALIVSVVCALIGGPLAIRSYHKMRELDLRLPRTRGSIGEEREALGHKVSEIRSASRRRSV